MSENKPIRVVAFASGGGSNVRAIYNNIVEGKLNAVLAGVISNNSSCGALEHARQHNIPALHISRKQFQSDTEFDQHLLKVLADLKTDLVILAGYMKMMPESVVRAFKNKILNIHPALLPSFGGKGLYGHFVHEAVLEYGVKSPASPCIWWIPNTTPARLFCSDASRFKMTIHRKHSPLGF